MVQATPPAPRPPLRSLRLQRLVLAILPAVLLGTLAATTVWGSDGLITRHELRQELAGARRDLGDLDRENQHLLWELRAMERDPVVLERVVADELGWGVEGATLYRFEDARPR
jgi:cell division protein FtsB